MEFEILKEKENPLFGRKEVQVSLNAEITPSKKEIRESLAQKFSSQPTNISVRGIHGRFGSKDYIIDANIYASKEEKEKLEPASKKELSAELENNSENEQSTNNIKSSGDNSSNPSEASEIKPEIKLNKTNPVENA